MSTHKKCDRCRLLDVQTTPGFDKDLCIACQADFKEWVTAGCGTEIPQISAPRAGSNERYRQFEALCRRDGMCTSTTLAAATGMLRTAANWYLHSIRRQGHAVFCGRGVFVLPAETKKMRMGEAQVIAAIRSARSGGGL